MNKSILSASSVLVLGVVLLLLNGISDSVFSRFYVDLTEEGMYSLSRGSQKIVSSLQQPVTLRYYFSKTEGSKFPAVKLYGTRIADLLREYARQSDGKITFEAYDPRPDSEEEEWAQKYGITPMQLPTGEKLFMGLAAVNAVGEESSIPVFNLTRQEFLEYDITKLLYTLSEVAKPVIGIISPLPIQGAPQMPMHQGAPPPQSQPWILVSQLEQFGEVKHLGTDLSAVPAEVKVLMVIHPKSLPEQTRYAIDQYAVKGGNLFVAVDPYCMADEPEQQPGNPLAAMTAERSSNLPEMLSAWGVNLLEKKVVGDINLATRVSLQRGEQPQGFVAWLTLGNETQTGDVIINKDDVSTSSLENVMLAWAGALEIKAVEGLKHEVLFRSSSEAMLYEETDIKFGGDNPEGLLKKYRRGDTSYPLGVRVSGALKSSFPSKPGEATPDAGGHVAQGTSPAHVVVISDADFMADQYSAVSQRLLGTQIVSLLNDNLIFAANSIENLTGSDDLISLRSRGKFMRPFTTVQQIEARAQEKWMLEEVQLQQSLSEANQRLSQLQSGTGQNQGKTMVVNQAMLDEIKRFREQRKEAQQRLREVRRKLREDKESLGGVLFFLNTFFVPLLLIAGSILYLRVKAKRIAKLRESES